MVLSFSTILRCHHLNIVSFVWYNWSVMQYLSSSPLQPGSHWVADSVSASRESHPSEDLSEPFPGVPLSSWLSSPTWEAISWSVTGFSLPPPLPCPRLEDHGVPHKWLSPGLMSQCLTIQFSMFSRGLWKRSLYLYMEFRRLFWPPPSEENFLLSSYSDSKHIFWLCRNNSNYISKKSLYYIWNGRGRF